MLLFTREAHKEDGGKVHKIRSSFSIDLLSIYLLNYSYGAIIEIDYWTSGITPGEELEGLRGSTESHISGSWRERLPAGDMIERDIMRPIALR